MGWGGRRTKFITLFLITEVATRLCAQPCPQIDGKAAEAKVIHLYEASIGTQSHLYNGADFESPPTEEGQHPYFLTEEFMEGQINYSGQRFDHVPMQYNTVSDHLIIEDGSTHNLIQLVPENTSWFTLDGRTFENLRQTTGGLTKGFYEVVYDGDIRVLARYEKSLQRRIIGQTLHHEYLPKNKLYIEMDGIFYPISSKKNIFSCLADKQGQIKQHMRQTHLRYRANPFIYCKTAVAYYGSITKP